MAQVKIQPFSDSYQSQIICLITDIQRKEFGLSVSIDDQPDLREISSLYIKGNGNFLVALDGEKVVGTIGILDIGNLEVALRKMFVIKAYRGNNVGVTQKLLNEIYHWCKSRGIRNIYLGTVSSFLAAHRFYEKNGFQEISKADLPPNFPIMKIDEKFYRFRFQD